MGPATLLTATDPTGGHGVGGEQSVEFHLLLGALVPDVTFCAAVTNTGDVVTSTHPTGGASAWTLSTLDSSIMFDSVSCASTRSASSAACRTTST